MLALPCPINQNFGEYDMDRMRVLQYFGPKILQRCRIFG